MNARESLLDSNLCTCQFLNYGWCENIIMFLSACSTDNRNTFVHGSYVIFFPYLSCVVYSGEMYEGHTGKQFYRMGLHAQRQKHFDDNEMHDLQRHF